jgi:hypothetical protein
VSTEPPAHSPSTLRSVTPPGGRVAPPSPAPSANPPRQAAPVATVARPQAPALIQASPVMPRPAVPLPAPQTPPWEQTQQDGRTDLVAPTSARDRLKVSAEAARARRRLYLIFGGAGLVALLLGVFFLVKVLTKPVEKPQEPPKVVGPTTYYVGPDEEIRTIGGALLRVRRGDTIIVRADVIREMIQIDAQKARSLKGVRILADEKQRVVWKPFDKPNPDAKLLSLEDADDFVIKGFDFDGEGKIKTLVGLLCDCRNIHFEDVKFRGYLETGMRFTNCTSPQKKNEEPKKSEVSKRVEVSKAEFTSPDKPPLIFEVFKEFPNNPRNEKIVIDDDCKFIGSPTVFRIIDLPGGESNDVKLPKTLAVQDVPRPPRR